MLPVISNFVSSQWRWLAGEQPEDDGTGESGIMSGSFEPTIKDVLVVRTMLVKALELPLEIVDSILDAAEFWPHTTAFENFANSPERERVAGATRSTEDLFLLRSIPLGFNRCPVVGVEDFRSNPPVPSHLDKSDDIAEYDIETLQKMIKSATPIVQHPCRKIVFTIRSHDQGWATRSADSGTYAGSWTWFEVGLERFDASYNATTAREPTSLDMADLQSIVPETSAEHGSQPRFRHDLHPHPARKVQSNVVAERTATEHRIEWRWTDDIDPLSNKAEELDAQGRGKATGNGEFVRSLKLGDVVTLWAKARFPGWANTVEKVQLDVYWAA